MTMMLMWMVMIRSWQRLILCFAHAFVSLIFRNILYVDSAKEVRQMCATFRPAAKPVRNIGLGAFFEMMLALYEAQIYKFAKH